MHVRVGTSGYQYKFWRGELYSEKCKEADMLREYGAQLSTVEINATFYRMPKAAVVENWGKQVPDDFRFSIKASRRITHIARLKEVADPLGYLLTNVRVLGDKLGVVLFQLPPNLKLDLDRLDRFLELLPDDVPVALEARNATWFDDKAYERLRARNIAFVVNDQGEGEDATPWVPTASFGYLRLRREDYTDDELSAVAAQITSQPWQHAFVFFKHEEGAPTRARRLLAALTAQASATTP